MAISTDGPWMNGGEKSPFYRRTEKSVSLTFWRLKLANFFKPNAQGLPSAGGDRPTTQKGN